MLHIYVLKQKYLNVCRRLITWNNCQAVFSPSIPPPSKFSRIQNAHNDYVTLAIVIYLEVMHHWSSPSGHSCSGKVTKTDQEWLFRFSCFKNMTNWVYIFKWRDHPSAGVQPSANNDGTIFKNRWNIVKLKKKTHLQNGFMCDINSNGVRFFRFSSCYFVCRARMKTDGKRI